MVRGVMGGVGAVVALFGVLLFAIFITTFLTGGNARMGLGTSAGLSIFFGGVTVSGAYLWWQMLGSGPAHSSAAQPGTGSAGAPGLPAGRQSVSAPAAPLASSVEHERRVLQLAESEHGRVTIPEVATHCAMTIEESKHELHQLVLQGVAEIYVTDSGVPVYVFPGFMSDEEKARAAGF
jgi:hypothetical protein